MRRVGRVASWADVEADLATGVGTLIVDSRCMGWNDSDVWWMPESISALAAAEGITIPANLTGPPDRDVFDARLNQPVFDRWCQARFFDESVGTAKFVQGTYSLRGVRKSLKRIEKLRSAFPRLEWVETYSDRKSVV